MWKLQLFFLNNPIITWTTRISSILNFEIPDQSLVMNNSWIKLRDFFFLNFEIPDELPCYVWQCWLLCTFLLVLSRGIVSCILLIVIYIECTMIHNAHLQVPFLYMNDNMTNRYKVFTFITTIFFYLYNTINIIYKCTHNYKRLPFMSSPFSNL